MVDCYYIYISALSIIWITSDSNSNKNSYMFKQKLLKPPFLDSVINAFVCICLKSIFYLQKLKYRPLEAAISCKIIKLKMAVYCS